jgi:hypothetical protein
MNDAAMHDEQPSPSPGSSFVLHRSSSKPDLLAVLALIALGTLFFADVLAGVNEFYMRDMTRYYYPAKQILREVVQHGEFPYWNRYFSAGQPIAANPEHEVFYPLTWLILLPSYDLGYRLHILIHIYIGLLGMYALLRSMEIRPFASFFGALSFGLGGLYLSYINLLPILFCAAWIPLTCLYTRRFLLHHHARDFGLASLFLGLQFLVAEPTTVLQTGFLLGTYALYRAWYSRPRGAKSITRVMWIGLISLGGLAIGAAQILPAIDHVRDSARSRPFEWSLVEAWSMPWAKLAELFYPNILGHISIKQVMWYWGGGLYTGMGSPFIFSTYSGLLVIALVVGAVFIRPRGGRYVFLVCLFSIIVALGGHTPLLHWLYNAGIVTSIRYPEKFILMAIFAVIIFAAQMLDRLLAGDNALRDGALGFLFAVTMIAAVIAIAGFTPMYAQAMTRIWSLTPGANANRIINLSHIDWIAAAVRGAVYIALLLTIRKCRVGLAIPPVAGRRDRLPYIWLGALAAVVAIDLGTVVYELNPRMPRRFFDPPPVAKTFPANRQELRIFHEADWYGTEETARKYFSTADAVYWIVRNGLFPMTPAGSKLRTVIERDYDKTLLLSTIDLTDSVWDVKRSGKQDWYLPFMAMSNAWYRGVYRNFEEERKRVHGRMKEAVPIDFLEGTHYPRYYFADQLITIKNRQDFVKNLIDTSFTAAVAFVTRPSFVPARGVVHSVHETANTATLDVESFGQGFLVMSVTPHKYWQVTVDGEETPPIVTNIAYQGIVVTPGRHKVVMRYQNELVRVGSLISVTAILALLVVAALRPRVTAPSIPAYEEPVHVVADARGMHVEPTGSQTAAPAALPEPSNDDGEHGS